MTIVTQEGELVNYNNVRNIATYTGKVEDTDVAAIIAFDVNGTIINEEIADGAIQLGVYNDIDECDAVMNTLIAAIAGDSRIFKMPEPKVVD